MVPLKTILAEAISFWKKWLELFPRQLIDGSPPTVRIVREDGTQKVLRVNDG